MFHLGLAEGSPAATILRHLQRHGQATIKELEDALGVSTTAVREQLANLHSNGLIATSTVRNGPGRPRFVYKLTERAQSLFPKQYDLLINLLLQEIRALDGQSKVELLFSRISARLAHEYAGRISGVDVQARLAELRAMLESDGIPAEVHADGDGIQIFACPYYEVAQEHPEVCTMERQMIEQMLGEELVIEQTIRDGHHHCCFVANRRPSEPGEIKLVS